jgi:malate synthase A
MEEIIYELRDHIVGLNCGRWDFIFSAIKTRRADSAFVLPDRSQVTMDGGFLRAYSRLLIQTCHHRGVHAMGGMAAQIPVRDDPEANATAMAKVRGDKEREVCDGHDGTWVAHPGLVPIAREIFDKVMTGSNQITRPIHGPAVTATQLLASPCGSRTDAGLRGNIRVAIRYLEAWLRGLGCVPLYGLMEDAATAEISRAQIWQWIHHAAALDDGRIVTRELVEQAIDEEMDRIREEVGDESFGSGRFGDARDLFEEMARAPELQDFLTLPAYRRLVGAEDTAADDAAR